MPAAAKSPPVSKPVPAAAPGQCSLSWPGFEDKIEEQLVNGKVLKMEDVPLPFTFTLNWNPSYSYATIPKEIKDIPRHWVVLNTPVMPPERGLCEFRNITIENVWFHSQGSQGRGLAVVGSSVTLQNIKTDGTLGDGVVVTGNAGQPVGDVLDLDIARRGIEQIEPPTR